MTELSLEEYKRKYRIAVEALRLAESAADKEWYTAEIATDIHNTLFDLGEIEGVNDAN